LKRMPLQTTFEEALTVLHRQMAEGLAASPLRSPEGTGQPGHDPRENAEEREWLE
jgi:hypothetical protein